MKVYPVYLNRLHEKRTVLIGGNHEAERKAGELLECDANITLVSEKITPGLQELADQGRLNWIPRTYQEGDLEGAFLVIVAEFEGDTNERVYKEADEAGILVNVMDDIPHCSFTFGSLIKRGPLAISISTSGAAPALAVRLRQRFEKEFGEEYGRFLEFMQTLRQPMAEQYPDFDARKKIWYELIDSDILELFRRGEDKAAVARAAEISGKEVVAQSEFN